jgi:hypothetical protein
VAAAALRNLGRQKTSVASRSPSRENLRRFDFLMRQGQQFRCFSIRKKNMLDERNIAMTRPCRRPCAACPPQRVTARTRPCTVDPAASAKFGGARS